MCSLIDPDDPDNQVLTPPVSFLDIDHPDKSFSIFIKDTFNQYFLKIDDPDNQVRIQPVSSRDGSARKRGGAVLSN